MSDDIRVYSGGGQGGEPRGNRAEDLKRFKRGRKAGDLVQGVFLRLAPVPSGTAWVNLEGSPLLAALPEDLADLARRVMAGQGAGATPTGVTEADFPIKNGQLCHFVLEAVEPEPVLRMLSLAGQTNLARAAAEARRLSLARLPPAQIAALYARQRTLLDNLLHRDLWRQKDLEIPFPSSPPPALLAALAAEAGAPANANPQNPQERYAAFIAQGEARGYFAEMESYRRALLENLRPYGLLGFLFAPWLCPAAFGLELAFTYDARSHILCDTRSRGPSVIYSLQGLLANEQAQADGPEFLPAVRRELSGSLCGSFTRRDPGAGEPDLLSRILALKPEETRTAFNRKA